MVMSKRRTLAAGNTTPKFAAAVLLWVSVVQPAGRTDVSAPTVAALGQVPAFAVGVVVVGVVVVGGVVGVVAVVVVAAEFALLPPPPPPQALTITNRNADVMPIARMISLPMALQTWVVKPALKVHRRQCPLNS
jgi:hypothetical protein